MERTSLTKEEKNYIEANIFSPLKPDIEKIVLFETTDRAKFMLESSLGSLRYDRALYKTKIDFFLTEEKILTVQVAVKHKDCAEELKFDTRFQLRK